MRVLVCGGREAENNSANRQLMLKVLDPIDIDIIIHGAAIGWDSLADSYAKKWRRCPVLAFPAKWDIYGKKAGFLRNKQMLEEGKPDLVVAFPGGRGTKIMVRLALEAGVPLIEVDADG